MVSCTIPVSQSECRDSRSTSTKGNKILYTKRLYSDHVIRNHYFKTKWVQEMNFTMADLSTDKSSCSKVEVLMEVQLMFN